MSLLGSIEFSHITPKFVIQALRFVSSVVEAKGRLIMLNKRKPDRVLSNDTISTIRFPITIHELNRSTSQPP